MLNNIKVRTEYSFRIAYGFIEQVVKTIDGDAIGICDRHGTWGHVQFAKYCKNMARSLFLELSWQQLKMPKKIRSRKQHTFHFGA